MKRLKPVLKEHEILSTNHGMLAMLPAPHFIPLQYCRQCSHFALPPQIYTAVKFPFPGSLSTDLTCPFVLQTYPNLSAIFPSTILSYLFPHAFTTMTISLPSTLLDLPQDIHPTTHVPFLTNDIHDQPPQAWTPIPLLAAIMTLLGPCIHHHIPPVSSIIPITRSILLPFSVTVLSCFTPTISYLSCSNADDSITNSMTEAMDNDMDDDDSISDRSSAFSSQVPSQYIEAPNDQELSQDSTFFTANTITPQSTNTRHSSQLHTTTFPPNLPPVSNPYPPTTTPPGTTTVIGHDPKRRCMPGDDHAAK